MANKDLKRESHHIRGRSEVWWYEVPGGIEVYFPGPSDRDNFVIPWRDVRDALARKDKKD